MACVQIFHRKTARRRGKDGVIPGDTAKNAFRFAQRVEKTGDQLCGAGAGMNHHYGIVIVDIQHQILRGLEVVGTPSSAGKQ